MAVAKIHVDPALETGVPRSGSRAQNSQAFLVNLDGSDQLLSVAAGSHRVAQLAKERGAAGRGLCGYGLQASLDPAP